ncbi:NAD(P)/FAD-dependent oxidoreductase [Desulfovibrio ferrophilus]|uniref:FAD/NAD(P)-binding domain-containing protein n=1 Tax=Desulfovibrio ferrophilus TaxID=241368 RepID=A0A2Z6B1Z8_9BACT|nr:FAD-dependent oxidoreductase [Desulfovibrio ferrophilus]BBD09426.1 putative uncharacterized protein [Desulfovibrio ferrophilus]
MGNLVLIGGGHAHAGVLFDIGKIVEQGHKVTLINPTPQHYYSGMGPGVLGGAYSPKEIRFPVKAMVTARGGTFIEDRMVSVDANTRTVHLASGDSVNYDVLSFNAGSVIPTPEDSAEQSKDVFTVKPIQNLWIGRERIEELLAKGPVRVAVVGGGPAALEVAGNARSVRVDNRIPEVTVFAGKKFLRNLPERIRGMVLGNFAKRGIKVLESGYAQKTETGKVILQSGEEHETDVIFLALGVRPPTLFADSNLPTGPDGGLTVNRSLQCVDHPEIFGGGDCIHFADQPLDKVGVYAVRQHPVLVHNLAAQLEGRELIPFDTGGKYLLVFNLGDGTGIFVKWGLVFGGKPAFWIKDYIDRKFMSLFDADNG